MKIGLVTSYMPPHLGGIEQIAESLYQGYRARGHEVRWVSSHVPATEPAEDGDRIRVPCLNAAERLLGVPVPIWGRRGWTEVGRLAQWADALHVLDCLYLPCAMAVAQARRRGKPVILSQNIGFIWYRLFALRWIESLAYATLGRRVLERASHVVLATPTAEAYVEALLRGRPAHISAFPIGVDTERFRPATAAERGRMRAHLELPTEGALVLFAGRLVEKKGVAIAIEVARRLPAVHLLVLGDGPLRGLLTTAPPNVTWRRGVPADRMPECYRAVDALLLPSHGEGLPLVVQEAMASGLPAVIADDEPYARSLLDHEACAGAARTPAAMAARLSEVLAHDRAELGSRARDYAARHWSLPTMVDRYVALVHQLTSAGQPSCSGARR